MPQVAQQEVKARAERLRRQGGERLSAHFAAQVGRRVEVLIERTGFGRTPDFAEVTMNEHAPAGAFIAARIVGYDGQRLKAEVVA